MDSMVERIRKLTDSIASVTPSALGYSIQSLCQVLNGKTENVFTVMRFSENDGATGKKEQIPGTNLLIISEWLDLAQGNQVIDDAVNNHSFTLKTATIILNSDVRPYIWNNIDEVWNRDAFPNYGVDRPAITALCSNNGTLPSVDRTSLIGTGYETLSDYIQFKLVSRTSTVAGGWSEFRSPGLYVIVPSLCAEIDSIEVVDSTVRIMVNPRYGDPVLNKLKLVCKVWTEGGREERRIVDSLSRTGVNLLNDFKESVDKVQATLLLEPKPGESHWIDKMTEEGKSSVTNARLNAHRLFFQDDEFLENRLLGKGADSIEFEWAVCTLFLLAGYQVDWWGLRKGMKNQKKKGVHEIDLLAFNDSSKRVLAIECTTSDGDISPKIQSVSSRSVRVREVLKGWEVVPMICTSLTKTQLESWRENSGQQPRLRVFTGDELRELLTRIENGDSFKRLAMEIERPTFL